MVNVQLVDFSGLPAKSRTAVGPPVTVTVYAVREARFAEGFRIHWFVLPLRETVAATLAPVAAFFSMTVPYRHPG